MRLAAWIFALLAVPAQAAPWEFSAPLDITPEQPGVFHQLDSAGRKHIAVSGDTVAVVWEQSRGGVSQVTVAFKPLSANVFSLLRVSGGGHGRRAGCRATRWRTFSSGVGTGRRFARARGGGGGTRPAVRLAQKASQPSLAVLDGKIVAVWSEERAGYPRIRIAHLILDGQRVSVDGAVRDVDAAPPKAEQLYPDVALTPAGVSVAWEDRREGHTMLLHTFSKDGRCFSKPKILNEQPTKRSEVYGKGRGAARVALARHGKRGIVAMWLDKRNFLEGYDVYAGFARDGTRFGRNERCRTTSAAISASGMRRWRRTAVGAWRWFEMTIATVPRICGWLGQRAPGSGVKASRCQSPRGRGSSRARQLLLMLRAICI